MNEISSESRVYVDLNIFIYFVELNSKYFKKAEEGGLKFEVQRASD